MPGLWRLWRDLMATSPAPNDRPPLRALTVAEIDEQIDYWRGRRALGTTKLTASDVAEVLDRLLDRRNTLTMKGAR